MNFPEACERGDVDRVIAILDTSTIAIDILNHGLYLACSRGHIDIIILLCKLGANDFEHALAGACSGGHLDIVEGLLAAGAKEITRGLGEACMAGHIDVVHFLLEKADNNIKAVNWGFTKACLGRQTVAAALMVERGCTAFDSVRWLRPEGQYLVYKSLSPEKRKVFWKASAAIRHNIPMIRVKDSMVRQLELPKEITQGLIWKQFLGSG
jgi:hypothetical protein